MPERREAVQKNAGTALPIEAFVEDAHGLDAREFGARHGRGFLMTATRLQIPTDSSTEVKLEHDRNERTAGISMVVFPVRPSQQTPVHLLTLGRTNNNDVVIRDTSVSRFHAYLKPAEGGGFLIQDAGSTNGTTVNGSAVPARGHGPPVQLKPGDDVRIGQVDFTFLGEL